MVSSIKCRSLSLSVMIHLILTTKPGTPVYIAAHMYMPTNYKIESSVETSGTPAVTCTPMIFKINFRNLILKNMMLSNVSSKENPFAKAKTLL